MSAEQWLTPEGRWMSSLTDEIALRAQHGLRCDRCGKLWCEEEPGYIRHVKHFETVPAGGQIKVTYDFCSEDERDAYFRNLESWRSGA